MGKRERESLGEKEREGEAGVGEREGLVTRKGDWGSGGSET